MPVLTQLNLNIGTEQNPNMVLHDLHDIRISSTDVNTVTRLLGCDAGVNSIAPLTLDKAASLLGVNKRGRVDATQSTNMKAVIPNDVSGNSGFLIYAVYGRSYNIGVCTFEFNGGIATLKAGFGTVDYTNNELSITLPGTTKGTVDYVIYSFSG